MEQTERCYKVSLVTPFHDVDMEMFKVAAASVKNQTIGFENIQWIIVLHNCKPQYYPLLKEMFGKDTNVRLEILDNDNHTPSSPRNYGVKFAAGEVIFYLDGDDSLLPDCIETVSREMKDTGSQVVVFRREYELEERGLSALTMLSLWNQTESRIVVDREHWDNEKMFGGAQFGFVTSCAFDAAFLRKNQIEFNTSIPMGEDVLYFMQCSALADKICYLPQYIGYHYFINKGSLVQNLKKSPEAVISIAEGHSRIFGFASDHGIDLGYNGIMASGILAIYILNCPELTVEQRTKIKDYVSKYVYNYEALPGTKYVSCIEVFKMMTLAKAVILNPENPLALPEVRDSIDGIWQLVEIVSDNANTDYGRKYSFKTIHSIAAFKFKVPVTEYSTYEPLIRLQTNIGESKIFTEAPVEYYLECLDGRLIPSTKKHFQPYVKSFANTLKGHHNFVMAAAFPPIGYANDGAVIEIMESLMMKEYLAHYLYDQNGPQATFCQTPGLFFNEDKKKNYRLFVKNALEDSKITQIAALSIVEIEKAFRILESDWKELLDEIRNDGFAERADEVESILRKGFDAPVAKLLWPLLERTVAFGAGELYRSLEYVKRFTGSVPHNHGCCYTEEAILGKAISDDSELFELERESTFYELVSWDDSSTCLWSEAEPNTPYHLIVTNSAGLYRYRTNHIVSIKNKSFSNVEMTIY